MQFTRNADNKLDYIKLSPSDSVQSISDALQQYLNFYPLSCDSCKESCCSVFPIRPDNVFMKQPEFFPVEKQQCNGNWFLKDALDFENRLYVMPKKETSNGAICYYCNDGKCTIYNERPILCRLYTCISISDRWNELLNIIVQAYKNALEYEIMEQTVRLRGGKVSPHPIEERNPALYADDYSLQIGKLLHWSNENGWNNNINFFD